MTAPASKRRRKDSSSIYTRLADAKLLRTARARSRRLDLRRLRSAPLRSQGRVSPEDPRHGTVNGYKNLGCRCDLCRAAATRYHRARRHANGSKPMAEYLAEVSRHGYRRYKKHKCRCESCRAAAAAQKRRQRANNADHYREYDRLRKQKVRAAA